MAISPLSATSSVSTISLPQVRSELLRRGPSDNLQHGVVGVGMVSLHLNREQRLARFGKLSSCFDYNQSLSSTTKGRLAAYVVCTAALNARCGAEGQTQTVEKPVSVISHAPGKEKSPQLDDGGTGFPPGDDDGGGGGGGGGGGNWSGGFFFFGFLAFLGFLKDQESEGPYQDSRRR